MQPGGTLQSLEIPSEFRTSVSMDFIVSLPLTASDHTAILVLVDYFSKMAHFVPTTNYLHAQETAAPFMHTVIRLHTCPGEIVSPRDPRFTSNFFREFCKLAGVHQNMSSDGQEDSLRPQFDGQIERVSQVLEDILRHYFGPLQDDWDTYLDSLEFAYYSSWHESLGTFPFKLLWGRNPQSPGQATHLSTTQAVAPEIPAAADFLQRRDLLQDRRKSACRLQETGKRSILTWIVVTSILRRERRYFS